MLPRPVLLTNSNDASKPAKRILFRTALMVAMIGSVLVSTILLLQGGLALGHLQYFIDIGHHPLHITSALLVLFGLLALLTFVLLTMGLIHMNRKYVLIAAGVLAACALVLVVFTIWSFLTVTSGRLPTSINNELIKEIDQTQYNFVQGSGVVVENTNKMARLEKQHQCCGLAEAVEDYRSRYPSMLPSPSSGSSSSGNTNNKGGRTTVSQRNSGNAGGESVILPISCCNEKYRSADNLCIDIHGNNSKAVSRYNTDGCYAIITRDKFQRIQQQGFTTVVAACLSVISCIALAAVIRLLPESYQVAPLPRAS